MMAAPGYKTNVYFMNETITSNIANNAKRRMEKSLLYRVTTLTTSHPRQNKCSTTQIF